MTNKKSAKQKPVTVTWENAESFVNSMQVNPEIYTVQTGHINEVPFNLRGINPHEFARKLLAGIVAVETRYCDVFGENKLRADATTMLHLKDGTGVAVYSNLEIAYYYAFGCSHAPKLYQVKGKLPLKQEIRCRKCKMLIGQYSSD